ncbi:hypothetical protein [Streptomyces sp. NPDC093544]|uniref:hypothetical protein n=1 Tax=Streptomyces sp. NPDC093544 TaxID=3155200 RepID=UPI003427AD9C
MSELPKSSPNIGVAEEAVEDLANVEHERWSHWQRYMHSKCIRNEDGSLTIPAELAQRWELQMNTPYAELSDVEKQSDREQVHRYLPVIVGILQPPPGE